MVPIVICGVKIRIPTIIGTKFLLGLILSQELGSKIGHISGY